MTGTALPLPPLHVVTDDRVLATDDFLSRARALVEAGGTELALHLRGPGTSGRRVHELARALRPDARSAGARLLVNDRVDVALAVGIDGVQLGERSLPVEEARRLLGPDVLIGASVHDVDRASAAARAGADFLIAGTIFATPSHPGRPGAGTGLLSGVRNVVGTPVVAIGGIEPGKVAEVLGAGARGVAVLRGIWEAGDVGGAARTYLRALAAAASPQGGGRAPGSEEEVG